MNAGYVRLSRDDDKRNYVSIENQKLIIQQCAAERGITIDRWYEDDGVSGYIFDRPGFNQLMADLDKDIDTVWVKDDCVINARTPKPLENRHFLRNSAKFRTIHRPQRVAYHIGTS